MNFNLNILDKITPKNLNPFSSMFDFIAKAKLAALIIGVVLIAIIILLVILFIKKTKKK